MGETPSAALVIIGSEILSGKTIDTNSRFLAKELFDLGVELNRISVIPDNIETIAEEVRSACEQHTFVITSGGVGPTPDDITMKGIASALGRKIYRHPDIERIIVAKYPDDPANAYRLAMADVPEGARLIDDPGFFLPVVEIENIFVLPGIPEILEMKFASMRDRFQADPYHVRKIYVQCDESEIVPHLMEIEETYPQIKLGSYPTMKESSYRVSVTLESKDSGPVEEAHQHLMRILPQEDIVEQP